MEGAVKKVVSFHGVPPTPLSDRRTYSPKTVLPKIESPKISRSDASTGDMVQTPEGGVDKAGSGRQSSKDGRGTTHQDASIVLTYLKKNKYDDAGMFWS